MRCQAVKLLLLECESPDRPAADVHDHIRDCADCRDWQRRLVLIERHVPFLPVPESTARASLLLKVLNPAPPGPSAEEQLVLTALKPPRNRIILALVSKFHRSLGPWRRTLMPAGGLAAALLLVAMAWLAWPENRNRQTVDGQTKNAGRPDRLLASLLQHDLRLADAETQRERVEVLADLAEDLQAETRALALEPDASAALTGLADCYRQVVLDGLVRRARSLPAQERLQVLEPIAARLARMGQETAGLAADAPGSSTDALQRMADTAREGDDRLRELVGEAAVIPNKGFRDGSHAAALVRGE